MLIKHKTRYWGRFKIDGKWSSLWHSIPASSRNEALGKFIKDTRFKASEVQITTKEPEKYAGRY